MENVEQIVSVAGVVAADHEAFEAARSEALAAEAALLDGLIERIRPALKALSSRVETSERNYWVGNTHQETDNECADWRGLHVLDEKVGPGRKKDSSGNSGEYYGLDIFLATDGTFRKLQYSGSFSYWQGSTSEWESVETDLTSLDVAKFGLTEEVISNIAQALDKQAKGDKKAATKTTLERAEKVRAISALLGSK